MVEAEHGRAVWHRRQAGLADHVEVFVGKRPRCLFSKLLKLHCRSSLGSVIQLSLHALSVPVSGSLVQSPPVVSLYTIYTRSQHLSYSAAIPPSSRFALPSSCSAFHYHHLRAPLHPKSHTAYISHPHPNICRALTQGTAYTTHTHSFPTLF